MTVHPTITILGQEIPLGFAKESVDGLRFLPDNPRVYAVTHGKPGFREMSPEQQQDLIFEALREEPSVKNLKKDVLRHKGLLERILVRKDTNEVVEGNSRLAVYRLLRNETADSFWDEIPCRLVSSLTEEQQAAYLQQIHVTGKTQWSAYEKANFAYVHRSERDWSVKRIADLFGESEATIRRKIAVIEMMAENSDPDREHFSYYDVLYGIQQNAKREHDRSLLWATVLGQIRGMKSDESADRYTAMELRRRLPDVMKKPKIERRFAAGKISLEDAFQSARISRVEERLRKALTMLRDITKTDMRALDQPRLNAFKQDARKAKREVERLNKIVEAIEHDK